MGNVGIIDSILAKAKSIAEREVLQVEKRTDLSEDQKVDKIIVIFSGICAGVAVQPIPFADFFILTPIQAFMATRIAAIRGVTVTQAKATDNLKELVGVIGLGLLAQHLGIGLYKTFVPFIAGFTTIPLVFGLTFGIGKVIDAYYVAKAKGKNLDNESLKAIFENEFKKGKEQGKRNQGEVNKYKDNISR